MQMTELSISEVSDLLRQKKISPVDLTSACLARIDQLNPTLNAFITVTHESAITEARAAEAEIFRGHWRGPLHGIPIGLKDLIDTAGIRTTCGSGLFADRIPTEDADVVQRLKQAGAVLIGKQNMQEFAYGALPHQVITVPFVIHGTRNEFQVDPPGTAAAVAAGCAWCDGSDTAVPFAAGCVLWDRWYQTYVRTCQHGGVFHFPGRLITSDHFVAT